MTPDWVVTPAHALAPGVVAMTICRTGPGASRGVYAQCNLGMGGDDAATVQANRAAVCDALALPTAPRWLRQVHGTSVIDLDRHDTPDAAADAARTTRPGTVCAVLTADCLPLLVAARDGSAVAAIHAGWRGLAAGVIEATLQSLALPGSALAVWLGPAIGATAYEVGEDVREAFVDHEVQAQTCFTPTRPGQLRLRAHGVREIQGGEHCTHRDAERFYSYRRDGACGRMASLIWITPHAS